LSEPIDQPLVILYVQRILIVKRHQLPQSHLAHRRRIRIFQSRGGQQIVASTVFQQFVTQLARNAMSIVDRSNAEFWF
jgi:hypothetical protein